MTPPIVLASSSIYRKEILARIIPDFVPKSPDIDESPKPGEQPQDLAQRLSLEKANAISTDFPRSLVIGSDQVAYLDGTIMGKPINHDHAVDQLQRCSGKTVLLYTGLALVNTLTGNTQVGVDVYAVQFRTLSLSLIETYLNADQPYDCCGSLKTEGLGVTLLEKMTGDDPNSLIGLPLIRLVTMLSKEGAHPLMGARKTAAPDVA